MFKDPIEVTSDTSCHFFEDQLLVFAQKNQSIYELNQSAGLVWLMCERRMSLDEVAQELSSSYGIDYETAITDTRALLEQWAATGLIAADKEILQVPAKDDETGHSENIPFDAKRHSGLEPVKTFGVRFAGHNYVFRFGDAHVADLIIPMFAHIETDADRAEFGMDVLKDANQTLIVSDGKVLDAFEDPSETSSRLTFQLVVMAYSKLDFLIAVHSASLSLGNGCVMFPGVCGVGKTTLAAGLIKAGFIHYTEDTAIVDRKTRKVIPTPVSLRIKEGSLGIVEKMFPGSLLPSVHYSADGRKLRYLPPSVGRFMSEPADGETVKALVFNRYEPHSDTRIERIPRVDAFRRIQECGYYMEGGLDRDRVSELLDWIRGIDCYELTISSLDEAIPVVREIAQ